MSNEDTRVISHRDPDEWRAALAIIDRDPVENCFVASRIDRHRATSSAPDPWRLGGEIWIHHVDGEIDSLVYSGANLVPVGVKSEASAHALAEFALRRGRRCSSIVGPAKPVHDMWEVLEESWGPARAIRARQPLMTISQAPKVDPDPRVREFEPVELDRIFPAAVAMFTEEIGVSPTTSDGGRAYRSRVAELLASGRSFGIMENEKVLFKAEIGAVTAHVSQIQGVWVDPERRGEGIGTAGVAAVVERALAMTPTVSLYVNDFNVAAIRCYERVGFEHAGDFASILF
jgi:uncharacterized protein